MEGLLWKLIWKRMVQLGKTHNFQIYFESNFVEMFCSIYTPPPPFLRCINEMLCVYVVLLIKLIQFCYFCAKGKCVFIIKLNTYIECKHSMKRGVWKSIWNECMFTKVSKKRAKVPKKRWNNKCTGISIDIVDLTYSQWDIIVKRVYWQRHVHRFHLIAFCVYHLWCRHIAMPQSIFI